MIPKNRLYKRPQRATYMLSIPVIFSRKDVTRATWPITRKNILEDLKYLGADILDQVERDVKNKR